MVNSITFENFRGLKKLELPELSQITLLTGRNNAGKSSVLEGLAMSLLPDPRQFALLNELRHLPVSLNSSKLWEPLFFNLDTRTALSIVTQFDKETCSVELFRDDNFVPASTIDNEQPVLKQLQQPQAFSYALKYRFFLSPYYEEGWIYPLSTGTRKEIGKQSGIFPKSISPKTIFDFGISTRNDEQIIEWCGQSILNGKEAEVVKAMKIIEPSIIDYSTIVQRGQTQIYVKIGNRLLPLALAGEGTIKLLETLLGLVENPGCLYLADEIETGFHYSTQKDFWRVLALTAKESNCQIIATTHSYECIQNAVDGIAEAGMEDSFCLYRLERRGEENRAFRLSGDLLHYSIDENMEVR